MSVVQTEPENMSDSQNDTAWTSPEPDQHLEYRSVSKAAIASCVFAVLGLASFMATAFVILPLLAVGFGIVALVAIKRMPDELLGLNFAKIGLGLGAVLFVGSVALHSYVYATEVPDGYTRINFWDLRNNKRTALPFSEKAIAMDGQRVFLKGYVRPGAKRKNLKDFIMVGDFGDCCFGGNPDITEIVEVNITSDDVVDHSYSLRKIGGIFRLNRSTKPVNEDDIPSVFYQIEADYVR